MRRRHLAVAAVVLVVLGSLGGCGRPGSDPDMGAEPVQAADASAGAPVASERRDLGARVAAPGMAEGVGAMPEPDAASDVSAVPAAVARADLAVGDLGAPQRVPAGAEVDVIVLVRNGAGDDTAAPSTVRLYLADSSGTAVAHLADQSVASLAPGASVVGVARVAMPAGLTGEYRLRAIADIDGAVVERDELNNVLDVPIAVVGADLAVRVTAAARTVASGGILEVEATVTNGAEGGAAPASRLRLTLVDGLGDVVAYLGDSRIGDLAPGASQVVGRAVTIPPGLRGAYWVRATADLYGSVDEQDEENNLAHAPIAVAGADLVVRHGAAALPSEPGAPLEVSVTVANEPYGGVASASTVRLYLADRAGNAVAHVADLEVRQLAPGEADTVAATAVVPPSVEPGAYVIRALADFSGAVAESDEANNLRDVEAIIVEP